MDDVTEPAPDLIAHLERTSGLDPVVLRHLVAEVLHYHDETVASYVRRRHVELQRAGQLRNSGIYAVIRKELGQRRFVSEELSERQIRRLVYG